MRGEDRYDKAISSIDNKSTIPTRCRQTQDSLDLYLEVKSDTFHSQC